MIIRSKKKRVLKPATITIVKPEESEVKKPALDLTKAKITIIKPESGLKVMVEEDEGEDE